MSIINKICFSSKEQYQKWIDNNCANCLLGSAYGFMYNKCRIQRNVENQLEHFTEVPLDVYNATQKTICPYQEPEIEIIENE